MSSIRFPRVEPRRSSSAGETWPTRRRRWLATQDCRGQDETRARIVVEAPAHVLRQDCCMSANGAGRKHSTNLSYLLSSQSAERSQHVNPFGTTNGASCHQQACNCDECGQVINTVRSGEVYVSPWHVQSGRSVHPPGATTKLLQNHSALQCCNEALWQTFVTRRRSKKVAGMHKSNVDVSSLNATPLLCSTSAECLPIPAVG